MSRNSIRNIILVHYIKLKRAKPIARLNMYNYDNKYRWL